MIHPSSDPSFAATNARTTDESVATASSYPPATAATRAPAASPRYPPRRCGSLHSACSGSRWTTYLAGPLPLGRDLREPRGTLLWRLPAGLLLANSGCSRWAPFTCFRDTWWLTETAAVVGTTVEGRSYLDVNWRASRHGQN